MTEQQIVNHLYGLQRFNPDMMEVNRKHPGYVLNKEAWAVEVLSGGGLDLSDYATKEWVIDNFIGKLTLDSTTAGKKFAISGDTGLFTEITDGGSGGGTEFTGTIVTSATTQAVISTATSLNAALTLHNVARTGSWNDLLNRPMIPSIEGLATETWVNNTFQLRAPSGGANTGKLFGVKDGDWVEITDVGGGTPFTFDGTIITSSTTQTPISTATTLNDAITLHNVARTGSWNDLLNRPTLVTSATGQAKITTAAVIPSALVLHDVARTGDYNDLLNKPSAGSAFTGTLATTTTPQTAITTPTSTDAAILLHEIARTGAIATRKEHTAGNTVGGVPAGTVFPIGTLVDDIIEQIFATLPLRGYSGALGFMSPLNMSHWITSLPSSVVDPQEGTQLKLILGEKVGQTMAFAYPATLRDAVSIVSANQGVVTSTFTKKTVMVLDSAGNEVAYKVYYMWNTINGPAGAIDDVYTLTI